MQELIDRGSRYAPLRADLLAFDVAFFQAGENVGFGDAQKLRDLRRRQQLRRGSASGSDTDAR